MQLRFLQMEFLYGEAMRFRVEDIIAKPVTFLPAILRELDRLPARIQRTMKIQCAEIAQREACIGQQGNVEIEAIADVPKIPERPPQELYQRVKTNKGDIALENLPPDPALAEAESQASIELARSSVLDFVERLNAKHNVDLPTEPIEAPPVPQPESLYSKKFEIDAKPSGTVRTGAINSRRRDRSLTTVSPGQCRSSPAFQPSAHRAIPPSAFLIPLPEDPYGSSAIGGLPLRLRPQGWSLIRNRPEWPSRPKANVTGGSPHLRL
jgi:hypothetical protein